MDSLSSALQSSRLVSDSSPHPNSIPITLTRSYNIKSFVTDVWVQLFSDRIVLGISQLDTKVGTFLSCHVDESVIDNRIRFTVTPLLGKTDDAILEVFCRQVTEKIAALRTSAATQCPPVLLGISLKTTSPETFHVLVNILVDLYKDAIQLASS